MLEGNLFLLSWFFHLYWFIELIVITNMELFILSL